MPGEDRMQPRTGSYVLVLWLEKARRLRVGKLGTFDFPSGYYVYFGSALSGLEARISRHLRQKRKRHWHIDFLATAAPVTQVWWTADGRRRECSWAKAALGRKGVTAPVDGFGSSDCRCRAHLTHAGTWAEVEALRRAVAPESVSRTGAGEDKPATPRQNG